MTQQIFRCNPLQLDTLQFYFWTCFHLISQNFFFVDCCLFWVLTCNECSKNYVNPEKTESISKQITPLAKKRAAIICRKKMIRFIFWLERCPSGEIWTNLKENEGFFKIKFSDWKMLQCLAAKKVETDSKFRNIVDIPKFKLPQRKFRISVPICRGRCRIFYFEKKWQLQLFEEKMNKVASPRTPIETRLHPVHLWITSMMSFKNDDRIQKVRKIF